MENIEILSVDFLFKMMFQLLRHTIFCKIFENSIHPYAFVFFHSISLSLSIYISRSKHLKMAICLYSHRAKISSNRNLCNWKIFTISSFRHVTQERYQSLKI